MQRIAHIGHGGILQGPLHGHPDDILGTELRVGQAAGDGNAQGNPVIPVPQQVQRHIQRHGHALGQEVIAFGGLAAQGQAFHHQFVTDIQCVTVDGHGGLGTQSPPIDVIARHIGREPGQVQTRHGHIEPDPEGLRKRIHIAINHQGQVPVAGGKAQVHGLVAACIDATDGQVHCGQIKTDRRCHRQILKAEEFIASQAKTANHDIEGVTGGRLFSPHVCLVTRQHCIGRGVFHQCQVSIPHGCISDL